MIDPLTAMAAVSTAVNLIKKASKTVDDVRSLGPLLGKYFDAKHEATKAVKAAKKKGGSNMGAAIQIEMELMQQRQFEEELKMMFFQTGNADVWQDIQARVARMNRDEALEIRREKKKPSGVKNKWPRWLRLLSVWCSFLGRLVQWLLPLTLATTIAKSQSRVGSDVQVTIQCISF